MPEITWFKDLSTIIQAAFATAAIMGAAIFAIFKLQLFRDFAPHLFVSHSINHRPIGNSYVHLDVTIALHNSSRVKIALREGKVFLQQIAPVLDDQELEERLEARSFIGDDRPFSQWPVLDTFEFDHGRYDLIIEPGQTFQHTLEFVIDKEITTIAINSFFYNSNFRSGKKKTRELGGKNGV